MKKIIVFTLLLMTIMSSSAKVIKTHFVKTRQQGGARSVMPLVIADQDAEEVTVEISRYCGEYTICIYDKYGMDVSCTNGVAEGNTSGIINIESLSVGTYTIEIVLGDTVYSGTFDIVE